MVSSPFGAGGSSHRHAGGRASRRWILADSSGGGRPVRPVHCSQDRRRSRLHPRGGHPGAATLIGSRASASATTCRLNPSGPTSGATRHVVGGSGHRRRGADRTAGSPVRRGRGREPERDRRERVATPVPGVDRTSAEPRQEPHAAILPLDTAAWEWPAEAGGRLSPRRRGSPRSPPRVGIGAGCGQRHRSPRHRRGPSRPRPAPKPPA